MAAVDFAYRRSPDQDAPEPARHPVVVVGAGPVGLTAAIDLTLRCVPVIVLDDADRIGEGSRAICFSKRTLELLDRLGVGETCLKKGVTWKFGKVFHGDTEVYRFDLLPEAGHKMPAFVNLQQFHLERYLLERAAGLGIDLRWRNRVTAIERRNDGAELTVETPDGPYRLAADWVVAADGAHSTLRRLLGLDWLGEAFDDRFLIADIRMHADLPAERRFWFDPPFHEGQSALMHKQPDDVWRIDLQLGPQADAEAEKCPERVLPRLKRMLGHDDFTLEWVSVYRFQCRRIARFLHGRVIFAGDAAHQVSPFGARGANSGIEDATNLAWKLALVVEGAAPEALMESYHVERSAAADEDIGHSTRSTDFIAPRTPAERRLRNAVLALAGSCDFARRMVNSGRLSRPALYDGPLTTLDEEAWDGPMRPGAALLDAPMRAGDRPAWLLDCLPRDFCLLAAAGGPPIDPPEGLAVLSIGGDLEDAEGHFAARYGAAPGACFLVRPDHYLAGRWRRYDRIKVEAALAQARGGPS
ncbi:MAG TPA: FAD-dependent oxidoreductase [Afifellaceae bacterium]|nr:FAD-dependent oxidoreductase [Afifellaceae bacterium]